MSRKFGKVAFFWPMSRKFGKVAFWELMSRKFGKVAFFGASDGKVSGSSPGRSGGRIVFSRVNFLC